MIGNARMAGALFLISTASYLIGSGLLSPLLEQSDVLAGLYADRNQAFTGLFLELINAVAVAGIAMLLYPALKKHNEAFAMGYFGSRIIESVILLVSLAAPIILIAMSQDYAAAEAASLSSLQAIANAAVESHFILFELAMIALGFGSFLLCYVLYRSRLVPRFLSVIGFIGYAGLLTSNALAITGHDTGAALYIPGAIFEIVFPLWLLIKGFNKDAVRT